MKRVLNVTVKRLGNGELVHYGVSKHGNSMGVFASTTAFSSGFLRRWIIACIALFLVFFFLSTDRLTLTGPSLKPSTWLESHNAGTTPITTTESVGHDGFVSDGAPSVRTLLIRDLDHSFTCAALLKHPTTGRTLAFRQPYS